MSLRKLSVYQPPVDEGNKWHINKQNLDPAHGFLIVHLSDRDVLQRIRYKLLTIFYFAVTSTDFARDTLDGGLRWPPLHARESGEIQNWLMSTGRNSGEQGKFRNDWWWAGKRHERGQAVWHNQELWLDSSMQRN